MTKSDKSERPKRPGPDATSAEIAQWMEEDFGWSVAEGIEKGVAAKKKKEAAAAEAAVDEAADDELDEAQKDEDESSAE